MSDRLFFDGVLHLFGQHSWHGDAYIAGSPESLKRLRDAVDSAIQKGYGRTEAWQNDGEGYDLFVVSLEDQHLSDMATSYTSEDADELRHPGPHFGPWDIIRHIRDTP